MDLFGLFWHPTILLFIGCASIFGFLLRHRTDFAHIDHGYFTILVGALVLTLATFIDYAEELSWGQSALMVLAGKAKLEGQSLPFIYTPGIALFGLGVSRWLPKVSSASMEVGRRKKIEQKQQKMLDEMRELAVRAEDARRVKAEFLANIGHELRTPLNAVIGFAELMQNSNATTPEKQDEYLEIIASSGRNLLNLINDMLEMARLQSGRVSLEANFFSLKDTIDECISYHRALIEDKQLQVNVKCEEKPVCSDRRIIKHIVLSLLSNAAKFTPMRGRLDVFVSATPESFSITFKDTGIGMSEEELARAMRPFVQLDSSLARKSEGAGLGLPLVDRFCRRVNGKMVIHSTKGHGTTIHIDVPQMAAATSDVMFKDEEKQPVLRVV
ncbi:sensor histidine kinase [Kordiimonas sp.]|uniref:sensor histidine kinase n=1 Tax=Kordiimonas sp. TaxID=1970157 RepID=UPI003A8E5071